MEQAFWHDKWQRNEIAFHEREANPLLVKYFGELGLAKDSRIFLPLCGKTLDISWLLSKGYRVVGAELSGIAVEELFSSLGSEATKSKLGGELVHYGAKNIDVFVGDIFNLSRETLGPVDAIYDRAALVALPEATRNRYAAHLMDITNEKPQLLICYEYDQSLAQGPPFSVNGDQVKRHYGANYQVVPLASTHVPGGLRGQCPANESVWLLKRRA
jgi:thiopurine S-methyltransferase